MTFEVQSSLLTCEYCGYEEAGDEPINGSQPKPWSPERTEQVLDFVMPTAAGQQWAAAQQQLKCERCGALSILPPGQRAHQCPYCGANQFIETLQEADLVEPQCIVLMKVNEDQAMQIAQRWLGKGVFAPDSLLRAATSLRLRPAYYSCWTFDGMVEMRWTCEVADGSGSNRRWRSSNGVEMQFFNDVLVPGVKALSTGTLEDLAPFNLVEAEEFKPDYLAGWPALLYDRPLSDASLVGREIVVRRMRPQMIDLVEIGREKRNLNVSGGSWSGLTFKHVLLPLWSGVYHFQGKEYSLLINGQTGKIVGSKPRDNFKLVFALLTILMFVALLVVLYWLLANPGAP
jgi:DNA-directed RNA polymerase subunit RPC12/RpoP